MSHLMFSNDRKGNWSRLCDVIEVLSRMWQHDLSRNFPLHMGISFNLNLVLKKYVIMNMPFLSSPFLISYTISSGAYLGLGEFRFYSGLNCQSYFCCGPFDRNKLSIASESRMRQTNLLSNFYLWPQVCYLFHLVE